MEITIEGIVFPYQTSAAGPTWEADNPTTVVCRWAHPLTPDAVVANCFIMKQSDGWRWELNDRYPFAKQPRPQITPSLAAAMLAASDHANELVCATLHRQIHHLTDRAERSENQLGVAQRRLQRGTNAAAAANKLPTAPAAVGTLLHAFGEQEEMALVCVVFDGPTPRATRLIFVGTRDEIEDERRKPRMALAGAQLHVLPLQSWSDVSHLART